jgi:hypothetical protein
MRPDLLKRTEWTLAILLTATALFLLIVRATHAGALWRDECAVVQLARLPRVADITRNFQHEAFPVPFPILIRAYTNLFGTSDFVLRCFGLSVGVALLAALWLNAYLVGHKLPIVSLSLLGLNTTFLVWGTTIRGYGLGSVLIIITFALMARLLVEPSPARVIAASLTSLACVQCLIHNLVLMFSLSGSAIVVCLARHNLRRTIIYLSILTLCVISFVPYFSAYSTASTWSQVVEFPVTLRTLWKQFNFALGNPTPALGWLWHVGLLGLIALSIRRLYPLWPSKPAPEWDCLTFGTLTAITAVLGYYEFLQVLNYLPRAWYYLALLSLLAVALDFLAATLSSWRWVRIGRLLFAAIALTVLPLNIWPKIIERQTNIDIVAQKVTELAGPTDLIVLAPWQYGISFNHYYHGITPWMTLPTISDLHVHRYDLFREKMLSARPIDDVVDKISDTLANGHRVWFVGGIKLPQEGHPTPFLPSAADKLTGWDNVAYSEAWRAQLGAFVRLHASRSETAALALPGPVNDFENVPLVVVDGWQ